MIYIERNSQRFGPYDDNALISYIETGQVLLSDKAYDDTKSKNTSVRQYIKDKHLRVKVQHAGSFTYRKHSIFRLDTHVP